MDVEGCFRICKKMYSKQIPRIRVNIPLSPFCPTTLITAKQHTRVTPHPNEIIANSQLPSGTVVDNKSTNDEEKLNSKAESRPIGRLGATFKYQSG